MENKKTTMSVILKSSAIEALGKSLELTQTQLTAARSMALKLSSDPALMACDQYSLVKCCFEVARYNFVREDAIYAVPYKGKVQAQMGYQGFRELAMRTGKYKRIDCKKVTSLDTIDVDPITGDAVVKFSKDFLSKDSAPAVAYYAYAIGKDGTIVKSVLWSVEKLKKHGKHYSKTYNSLWGDETNGGFEAMAKKTLIKQLCKDLETTPEIKSAIELDQKVFGREKEPDTYEDNPNNSIQENIFVPDDTRNETTVTTKLPAPDKEASRQTTIVEASVSDHAGDFPEDEELDF